jgi:hypothetical protein
VVVVVVVVVVVEVEVVVVDMISIEGFRGPSVFSTSRPQLLGDIAGVQGRVTPGRVSRAPTCTS